MIRPARFAANPETAGSNRFQARGAAPIETSRHARPASSTVSPWRSPRRGVRVHAFAGARDADLPDEVFPNNWLSLHADGTAVLYPMLAPNRRRERRADVLDALRDEHGYRISRVLDLTTLERAASSSKAPAASCSIDVNRVAYACLSPRTHPTALAEFGRELGYETLAFDAVDRDGTPIYHTNVLLSIGTRFAALCTRALRDEAERAALDRLEASRPRGRRAQLRAARMRSRATCSSCAAAAARDRAVADGARVARRGATRARSRRMANSSWPTSARSRRYGGGSVRCMLAEVALPRA